MLKKNAIKRILISTLALLILLCVYMFPEKNNDISSDINYINAVKMPIYLIDKNGFVSRINILKNTEEINNSIKEVINYLTIGSIKSDYIPSDFKAIIPENTKLLDMSLENKLLKLNFSKEFFNVPLEDEVKLIESIIFSLCEFSQVDKIMIFVEENHLNVLPHSKKALPQVLDKTFGINKVYDLTSLKNVEHTTNYYLGKSEDFTYYIPISKYENSNLEKVEIIINNLKTTPVNQTNLISYLKATATLESYEVLEQTISLSFNNKLIADLSDNQILEEVKYSIYLSIRDTYNVKAVLFEFENEKNLSVLLD